MENPFDLILSRLQRIENLLEKKQSDMPIQSSPLMIPPTPSEKLLTVQMAADFLNLKVGSVYQLVHRNGIPYYKRGKHLIFTEKSLRSWIEQTRHQTVSEIQSEALKSLSNQ